MHQALTTKVVASLAPKAMIKKDGLLKPPASFVKSYGSAFDQDHIKGASIWTCVLHDSSGNLLIAAN